MAGFDSQNKKASIENCQKIAYDTGVIHPNVKKSIGVDPSYGSSNFAIVATQYVAGKIQVIGSGGISETQFY